MPTRRATLDDARAICDLFCATIERWQRMDEQGRVEDLPYEQLTIYDRWLHGGAWMSIETAALWLSHLVRGAAMPFVLEDDSGAITGYVEAYPGNEPDPYRHHLHVGSMVTASHTDETKDVLMQLLLEQAGSSGRITVACTIYDSATINYYKRYGMAEIDTIQQITIPTLGSSVGFYKVSDHAKDTFSQVEGWSMPIGRIQNARYHWEQLWPQLWQAAPQIVARRIHRQHFNAAGQEALVCCQQHLYNPRSAEIYCWTARPLSTQLVNSIRDWAHKQGYRTLTMAVSEKTVVLLGPNVEKTPYQQVILARDV